MPCGAHLSEVNVVLTLYMKPLIDDPPHKCGKPLMPTDITGLRCLAACSVTAPQYKDSRSSLFTTTFLITLRYPFSKFNYLVEYEDRCHRSRLHRLRLCLLDGSPRSQRQVVGCKCFLLSDREDTSHVIIVLRPLYDHPQYMPQRSTRLRRTQM